MFDDGNGTLHCRKSNREPNWLKILIAISLLKRFTLFSTSSIVFLWFCWGKKLTEKTRLCEEILLMMKYKSWPLRSVGDSAITLIEKHTEAFVNWLQVESYLEQKKLITAQVCCYVEQHKLIFETGKFRESSRENFIQLWARNASRTSSKFSVKKLNDENRYIKAERALMKLSHNVRNRLLIW